MVMFLLARERAGGAGAGEGEGGVVGREVGDRAAVEGERVGGGVVEGRHVVAGLDGVVEDEGGAAATGGVGGRLGRGGVERQLRVAGDGDRLGEGDLEVDGLAGVVGAVRVRGRDAADRRRGGVDGDALVRARGSLRCRGCESVRVALLPAGSAMRAAVEGERVGAGVVEGRRRCRRPGRCSRRSASRCRCRRRRWRTRPGWC